MPKRDSSFDWEEDGDRERIEKFFLNCNADVETKERIKQLAMLKMEREEENDKLGIDNNNQYSTKENFLKKIFLRFSSFTKNLVSRRGTKIALPLLGLFIFTIIGYGGNEIFVKKVSQDSIGSVSVNEKGFIESGSADSKNKTGAAGDFAVPLTGQNTSVTDNGQSQNYPRKIIQNMHVALQVENVADTIEKISNEAKNSGGYVVESYHRGSDKDSNGHVIVKIPGDKLAIFQENIVDWGKILSQQLSGNDITYEYYDTQIRLKHWQDEQERYLDILKQAKSVEDILKVEEALANVRQQIEQLEGQIKLWDNQVNYAEVYFELQRTADLSPVIEDPWQPVKWQATIKAVQNAFIKTISIIWNGFNYAFVGLGYLLPLILVGSAGWWGYRICRKRR